MFKEINRAKLANAGWMTVKDDRIWIDIAFFFPKYSIMKGVCFHVGNGYNIGVDKSLNFKCSYF